jgi:hypothetical protein
MNPVDSEVSLVRGEYFADTFSLGDSDKRCVSKIHRAIGVFSPKFTDARQIDQAKRKQLQRLPHQHLP